MSSNKIIAVLGATGAQGGSVVQTFLNLPGWQVRAVTRNTESKNAQDLIAKGAEAVQADQDDLQTLKSAFAGVHAIFAPTDFWTPIFNPESWKEAASQGKSVLEWAYDLEAQRGKNIAEAAASNSTLERFVFSSLAAVSKISGGKYKHAYHFDGKAAIVDYIKSNIPALAKKMSTIQVGYYYSNLFAPNWLPAKQSDGTFTHTQTCSKDAKHPFISIKDEAGPFVKALVLDEEPGSNLLAYSEWLSFGEVVDMWSRVTGKQCSFVENTIEQAEEAVPGIGGAIAESTRFSAEYGFDGGEAMHPRDLKTKLPVRRLEEWMKEQDWTPALGK